MIKHQIKSYLENAKQVFSIKFISVLIISFPSAIIALGIEIIRTVTNFIEKTCFALLR